MEKFYVLKPQLVWINGRCYRKFKSRQEIQVNPEDEEFYHDTTVKLNAEKDSTNIQIFHDENKFWTTKQLPAVLYEYICVPTKKMAKQLKARIDIPKLRNQDYVEITISANNARSVEEAFRRIDVLVESQKRHMPFTHFISIPMNDKSIQMAFNKFKVEVLRECIKVRGIHESIFQSPEKLHLTIATLLLQVNQDKERVKETFEKCKEDISNILGRQPLKVQVKGIEYMNDDPEEVDVLYAKVSDINGKCLQVISDSILKDFNLTNLTTRDDESSIRLHITLMNTLFRSSDQSSDGKKERETFDARPILEKFGNFDFGAVYINEIHASIRFTTWDDGYYIPLTVLKL